MGTNGYGQLGIGTTVNTNQPVYVTNNVVAVAAGGYHSLLVKADGTLWAMGYNYYGQLGNGGNADIYQPVYVTNNVVAVAAALHHSLFVKADGTLWGMGRNDYGQLGTGTTNNSSLPVSVASNVVAVAVGYNHSLFVKAGGGLWSMGINANGQLGTGTTVNTNQPVYVTNNVVAVAAGYNHSLFVKADGTLWAMGGNSPYGQLGNGSTISTNLPVNVVGFSVASLGAMDGASHSLAVGDYLPPAIGLASLTNQTITAGQPCTFTLVVTNGGGPFTYQWQLNGTNIANATNASYAVASASLADAGTYTGAVIGNLVWASQSATLIVNKATPVVTTWPTATAITYGQTLASSTLSGGAATPAGTFAFTTPSTAPSVGTAAQAVTFTPTDAANYSTTNGTASVLVNKATPSVTTWPTATAITYGQTLASSTLSGGAASVAGSFAFTTPSTAPSAGTAAQNVTFTPTVPANYNSVSGTASVLVNKATPSVTTWPTATAITNGQTLASSTLSGGAASVAGSFAFTTPTTAPSAGTAAQNVTFIPADTGNYATTNWTVSVTVYQASTTTTLASSESPAASGASITFTATISPGAASGTVAFKEGAITLSTGTLGGGVATFSSSALASGSHAIRAEYVGDANYLGSTNIVTQVITKVTVNHAPTAGAHYLGATINTPLRFNATVLSSLDSDVDGDALSVISVTSPSTHGTVSLSLDTMTYTPTVSYVGNDQFTYTISDGLLTATCTAHVTVRLGQVTAVFNYISATSGTVDLRGYGIPSHVYDVQYSITADFATIAGTFGPVTAAANGMLTYTDATAGAGPRYYRFAVHAP